MEEEWRIIADFPDYQVSNLGRVKSLYKNKLLRPKKHNKGYETICLSKDKILYYRLIHRLVALNFIDQIDGKPEIDHIDGNKKNNCVSNLRWVNHSENNLNKEKTKKANYISKNSAGHFQVRIKNTKIYVDRTFNTLEEAVTYRDFILNQIPTY